MDSKGKIEIVFGDKGVEICIDGLFGAGDASFTLGAIMGTLLKEANEDVMMDALRTFVEAAMSKYAEE